MDSWELLSLAVTARGRWMTVSVEGYKRVERTVVSDFDGDKSPFMFMSQAW
jgi:hypothetical protein